MFNCLIRACSEGRKAGRRVKLVILNLDLQLLPSFFPAFGVGFAFKPDINKQWPLGLG